MAKTLSTLAVIKIGANDISQYVKTHDYSRTAGTSAITGYGKASQVYGGTLKDGTWTCGGVYDNTASTGPKPVVEPQIGNTVVLTYRPEGTGAGKPQSVVNIVVTGYTESGAVEDYIQWSMTAQMSDDVNTTAQ